MDDFPPFMKTPLNAIAPSQQSAGVEGYVFDGRDGSQMAFWTCSRDGQSEEHVHDFDEYFVVLAGRYTLILSGRRIPLEGGQEYVIQRGVAHGCYLR